MDYPRLPSRFFKPPVLAREIVHGQLR
ncbi:protein of unknown function [Cupriavidus taiwanensis]|uniref:Uncharacterized protein n=1 Tax=Cupriavidus taiwanensis TaxID=164546 RepID=A0A7Z7NN35_9BURK|nr:protein of unknown function [Cupriavidus taiwanensis]SOZ06071.1 hypothetical protein CBM2595_A80756 [Cupriavidus taiwanensis]SOZ08057.1 hypothetical protein CBM2597_A90663 [Cupriavidus taiwanensis]SPC18602.1 hypothetical protein CBM2594_A80041 [Cupriavidus taiwanensis]SPD40821.1 protein of unknown function [Cupriavidus taiwanensis]